MLNKPDSDPSKSKDVVIIKKYANRRLYNTETSSYVTLEDIAQMVRSDREFQVFDAKSGDDLTHSVLTQIIVEQESRSGAPSLLPIPFLRQLIRFYDDSLARMVPSYLQLSLDTLMREQDRFRKQLGPTWAGHAFETYQEQTRRNLALFEQAMKLWTPFGPLPLRPNDPAVPVEPASEPAKAEAQIQVERTDGAPELENGAKPSSDGRLPSDASGGANRMDDLAEMRAQLAAMQAQIERMARDRQ